MVLIT